ncbi:MAG: two component transcriptional regulator, AraC family [Clostridia bacterium]|jgi:two-component system response regulator YesN|nr:two component transcriptional regulator, AraC family [Clostridia bacterium]
MYKLILVDDEEEVRKGILQKIEWAKYGFEIAGEAENGREALEIAEKTMPDVVITDIKMPFMDGIKLAEQLREKFPTTKIVILTGFDEFEYAQKAIKLNVVEYVLKPVSSHEMIEILVKVKSQIDKEIAEKEDMQALREHYRKSLPVLKEKFLTSLITSKLGKAEIKEKSQSYNINLNGNGFVASIVSIDYHTVNSESTAFNMPEDKGLLNFAVLNISDEIVNKYNLGTVFLHNDHIVIITVCEEDDSDTVMNKTLSALEEIRQSIEKFLKFTVTIGVGTVCNDIVFIKYSYQNAVLALDYRLVYGNNRIIWIEDVEPRCVDKIEFDELKEHALTSCIKVGTAKEITETIDSLFEEITDVKASFKDYQIYLLEMLTTVLKAAKGSNVDMADVFGPNYNLFVELYKFNDIEAVKDWLTGICIKIMSYISKDRQDTCKLLAEKAKEYAQSHYHESDITINKVCKCLHISPAYFSSIFKKETKMTFMNYLLQIRMEAAKELLRTTNMKTFEIAERVGYSEPNYFSYCFKKYLGISPTEYRNSF